MLNIEPGLCNLLIYLTKNLREVKCSDQKTLLKQNAALYLLISITDVEPIFICGASIGSRLT